MFASLEGVWKKAPWSACLACRCAKLVGKQRALRCTVIPQEPRALFAGVQPLSPRAACSPPRPPRTPGRGLVPVARALAACYFSLWVSFYFRSGVGLSPGRLGCRLWHVLPLQKTSLNATHRVSEQPPERGNQTVSKAVAGTGALRGRRGGGVPEWGSRRGVGGGAQARWQMLRVPGPLGRRRGGRSGGPGGAGARGGSSSGRRLGAGALPVEHAGRERRVAASAQSFPPPCRFQQAPPSLQSQPSLSAKCAPLCKAAQRSCTEASFEKITSISCSGAGGGSPPKAAQIFPARL